MSIRFFCPSGHRLSVSENLAGRSGVCPLCQQSVLVPTESDPAAEQAGEGPPAVGQRMPPKRPPRPQPRPVEAPPPQPQTPLSAPSPPPPPPPPPPPSPGQHPPPIPKSRHARRAEPAWSDVPQGLGLPQGLAKPQAVPPPPPPAKGPPPGPIPGKQPQTPPVPRAAKPAANKRSWISDTPGYRPDKSKLQTVYWLAAGLLALTAVCLWPAVKHYDHLATPTWAKVVLLLSALQLSYIAWMLSVPDWSTLRVMMVVFTVVSALYGTGMTIAFFSSPDDPAAGGSFLQLHDVQQYAATWCALVVLLGGLMTYLLGRCDSRWRKAFRLSVRKERS